MLKLFVLAVLVAVSAAYTTLEVSFYKANSGCSTASKPPQANQTYTLNKCYNGIMYDCDPYGGVSYMVFPDVNCMSQYPGSYGLPSFFCMSPVYAYSSYDTYMYCY